MAVVIENEKHSTEKTEEKNRSKNVKLTRISRRINRNTHTHSYVKKRDTARENNAKTQSVNQLIELRERKKIRIPTTNLMK